MTAALEHMVSLTVDTTQADYAVFTGVQIHRPVEGSLVWLDQKYVCVQGKRHQLEL